MMLSGYRVWRSRAMVAVFRPQHVVSHHRQQSILVAPAVQMSTRTGSFTKKDTITNQANSPSAFSAASIAAAAVNAAIHMRPITATSDLRVKSFVSKDSADPNRIGKVDEVGLPLIYDKELIEAYWKKQGSALTSRWTEFLGYTVPFVTKVTTLLLTGGREEVKRNGGKLARDARIIMEKLGPTYVKMGQMLSVRPDVLPKEALEELKILQDSVKAFDSDTAIRQIESELGGELGTFFSEISLEPVAAASLAQVYKAKLKGTDEYVAIKVQRPAILETVSKDLYVLRRAAEVYQGLMDRFAPQQKTNYVALLNEWAIGFYTELDFLNEAANQMRLKDCLTAEGVTGMYIPRVYPQLCTRRILVSEWVDGVKLSNCTPAVIAELIPEAQEVFLTQLLQIGSFHADPHPGNIFRLNEPRGNAKMALLDFGLVATVRQADRDTMVSALIHLANRDYGSLVDDFVQLDILPVDCDRAKVVPLMDKALTPYVKGGGVQGYEEELRRTYGMDGSLRGSAGGLQAMAQDALTVLNDIPFSIPPYFALLGRAIITLEGIALTGNPRYGIVMESYPFVARKLLREDRPELQRALQQVLYSKGNQDKLQATRLSVLLNSALGVVAKTSDAFVDLDSIPDNAVSVAQSIKFLLSPKAASLRHVLTEEMITATDVLLRQSVRKAFTSWSNVLPRVPLIGRFLPRVDQIKLPFLVPQIHDTTASLEIDLTQVRFKSVLATAEDVLHQGFPKLTREEELYALSLADAAMQTFGPELAGLVNGNIWIDARQASSLFTLMRTSLPSSPVVGKVLHQPVLRALFDLVMFPLLSVQRVFSRLAPRDDTSQTNSETSLNRGLHDLLEGINSLDVDEQAVLRQQLQVVGSAVLKRHLHRLQPMISSTT